MLLYFALILGVSFVTATRHFSQSYVITDVGTIPLFRIHIMEIKSDGDPYSSFPWNRSRAKCPQKDEIRALLAVHLASSALTRVNPGCIGAKRLHELKGLGRQRGASRRCGRRQRQRNIG